MTEFNHIAAVHETMTPPHEIHQLESDVSFDEAVAMEQIQPLLQELMSLGYKGDVEVDMHRTRRQVDWENPSLQRLIDATPGCEHWIRQIPTAAALVPLYDPYQTTLTNGHDITPEMRAFYLGLADARGVRNRGNKLAELATTCALALADDQPVSYTSFGGGAGQPLMQAVRRVRHQGLPDPMITIADYDPRALQLAKQTAIEAGCENSVHCRQVDLRQLVIDQSSNEHAFMAESQDFVDAIGLPEYFPSGDTTKEGRTYAGVETLLHNAWRIVKPGGMLVAGNMLDTHPEKAFTLNTLNWPHIQPRSIETMLGIISQAGITSPVDVHLTPDGVYALYAMEKPAWR